MQDYALLAERIMPVSREKLARDGFGNLQDLIDENAAAELYCPRLSLLHENEESVSQGYYLHKTPQSYCI